MFLQSTLYSPVRSVPSVNIPLSSLLCTSSQHSTLQSALFLQSTFRSVPPVNIQSALFLQATFNSPVSSVPSVKIPLSRPHCSSSQHFTVQAALFFLSKFRSPVRSVPPVKIPLSSKICFSSQHSTFQSSLFLQ